MKFLVLMAALAHAAHGGNIGFRATNLLAPADVTYVDGAYHAGLAAGPVAYSAAPVAYAAPAPRYAAVPTVQHVPGVADVPVTRIDAQPTVIQKTVDIARPAVKTQRYEVRRPAIQKQFYDIEERVVVRPAGSALVELDEPVSKTQKGPSVIRPTGEGVAVSSAAVAAVSPAPAELPSVEINLARSAIPAPAPTVSVAPSVEVRASSPSVEVRASVPSVSPAPSVGLSRAAFSAPSVQVRNSFAAPVAYSAPAPVQSVAYSAPAHAQAVSYSAPAPAPPQAVSYSAPAQAQAVSYSAPSPAPTVSYSAPAQAQAVSYSAPAPAQAVSYSAPAPAQAVSYSAPAPVHSISYSAPAPVPSVSFSAPFAAHSVGISPIKTVSVSAPIQTTISGVSSISSGVSGISHVPAQPSPVTISTPAPQYEQQIVQSTPAPQLSDDSDSVSIDNADFGLARSGLSRSYSGPQTFPAHAPAPETVFRSQLPPRRFTGQPPAAARSSLVVDYPNAVDLIPQSRFRSGPVYEGSYRSSEISQDNQQKLIQLLTARGEVSEVGLGRSGSASHPLSAGQVRARVLSATPAPAYAAPAGERVNTRRVVVSRPIETLQEVEVAEPVTKFERVRVEQPAVVKTASQDIVRVPTSVPVYGKALAPVADAPAYPADWH